MKITLQYECVLWSERPNNIGLIARGFPKPEKRYEHNLSKIVVSICERLPARLAKKMCDKAVKITVNNDPLQPEDELFVQYEFPFKAELIADLFVEHLPEFITEYYGLKLEKAFRTDWQSPLYPSTTP